MSFYNGGLEPEDRQPDSERSQNVDMGSPSEPTLDLGKLRARELGLNIRMFHAPAQNIQGRPQEERFDYFYNADDIHRLLGEGQKKRSISGRNHIWENEFDCFPQHIYHGLLIGIREIVQESDERKLFREMIAYLERSYPLMPYPDDQKYRADIAYRAKAMLEKGGGK